MLRLTPTCVCDLRLVRHSNLGTVAEILHVFMLMTSPLFHPNFGGVPVGSDRRCWGQSEQVP